MKTEVIIAVINKDQSDRLAEMLKRLLKQSFQEFEVVICDGRSRDGSLRVLEDYKKKDKRIHYFIQKSTGTGSARNEIIDYIRQKFSDVKEVIWLDSDNVPIDDNYLKEMLNAKASIVGGANIIDSSKPVAQASWKLFNPVIGNWATGGNCRVKWEIYEKFKYTSIRNALDDLVFLLKLQNKANINIIFNPKAKCLTCAPESIDKFTIRLLKRWPFTYEALMKEGVLITFLKSFFPYSASIYFLLTLAFLALLTYNILLLLSVCLTIALLSYYIYNGGKKFVLNMRLKTLLYIPLIVFLDVFLKTICFLKFLLQLLGRKIQLKKILKL